MQDTEFLIQFEDCTLAKNEFKHYGHLRICWLYLSAHSFEEAAKLIREGVLRFETSLGAKHIYHETLTHAWIKLIYKSMQEESNTFADFINKNYYLLDKHIPFQYYSKELLESDRARADFLPPDLKKF